jgi:hypothetical protein
MRVKKKENREEEKENKNEVGRKLTFLWTQ